MSAQQVDDGRSLMGCGGIIGRGLGDTHAYTAVLTGTENLGTLIGGHGLRHVDKDIAAVLHEVFLLFAEIALTGTIDLLDGVPRVVSVNRTEVDKGIA